MLLALTVVTRRPMHLSDDQDAQLYLRVMHAALMEYPIDVVHHAMSEWRKGPGGEWWPAEAEIRRLCEKLFAPRRALRTATLRLIEKLEADEEHARREAQPSYFPGGAAAEFRRRCQKKMTARAFDCWFHAADIIYAGNDILVRTKIADIVFNRDWREDLRELGLIVRHDHEAFANIPERRGEEATPEEREAFVAELRGLAGKMAASLTPKDPKPKLQPKPKEQAEDAA